MSPPDDGAPADPPSGVDAVADREVGGEEAPGGGAPADVFAGRGAGRRRRLVSVTLAAVVLVLGVAVAVREPPGPPGAGERVVLYGDSLAGEAGGAFTRALAARTEATVEVQATPGGAVCDALAAIRADVARADTRPAVAVLQFAGNNGTPCILGDAGRRTGADLAARYAADMRAAVEVLAAHEVRVVIVGAPPTPGLPGGAGELIDDAYETIVTEWAGRDIGRVRYADAGSTVTGEDGRYVPRLPCRDGEGAAEGCEDGAIAVRNPDRIHFCPAPADDRLACPVHSSGAERFAAEMARVTALALSPTY